MKKNIKTLFSIIFVLFSLTATVSAVGAGVQLGFSPSFELNSSGANFNNFESSVVGTIKCSRLPINFGFGLTTGKSKATYDFGISGFIDYIGIDTQIKNNLSIYSGFGIGNNFTFTTDKVMNNLLNGRVFVGLDWLFLDNFVEFYIQQNICPGINFNSAIENKTFILSTPFETGVRWHF